ncbi:MAG: histone deacetylase [Thermoplasmatales archaeon]|nr:histone deacetylase [Thermoplasmatales archaeon]
MIAVAYHANYSKYDLGEAHPLLGDKPKRTLEFLMEKNVEMKVFEPEPVTYEELLAVHPKGFVEEIKNLSEFGGMLAVDTPAPKGIYDTARTASGGTKIMGVKVMEEFFCGVNLLGGFHHAGVDTASGFCFFNDIAVAVEFLRKKYGIKRFLVIDLDVHHCNGTQEIYYKDNSVLVVSMHQDGRTLYPGTGFIDEIGEDDGKGFNVNIPLPPGTGNKSYLYAFDEIIPRIAKQFKPEIIFYQSGVDTHHSDPLANLNLTFDVYHDLGKRVRDIAMDTCKKLVVCLGGGYSLEPSVKSYYNIVSGILDLKDFVSEKNIPDKKIDDVKNVVSYVKNKLADYWKV